MTPEIPQPMLPEMRELLELPPPFDAGQEAEIPSGETGQDG